MVGNGYSSVSGHWMNESQWVLNVSVLKFGTEREVSDVRTFVLPE